ncbi:hypothetical protein FBUS_03728 [Fasciolopsis buskii]|uniref:Uncharacterized protein n=1 Tax=Fasciolopsis buskii TaxID=27845 RepID=A0A8E0VNR2_9TREM|nr:hypothetical protein FBUS_03728 [Fasciolopsis buski]
MFNAQPHSGLKLNLPQGFALDEYTKAMHPFQLDADDERLSAAYKIAKMDSRALPTNVQDNVQCLPSTSPEVINQTIYQYNSPQAQLIPGTTGGNISLGDCTDNSLADLHLSRCTTPISLIQPDSVDLTEFLAAAMGGTAPDEGDTEINMDDLFPASAALDSSSAKV